MKILSSDPVSSLKKSLRVRRFPSTYNIWHTEISCSCSKRQGCESLVWAGNFLEKASTATIRVRTSSRVVRKVTAKRWPSSPWEVPGYFVKLIYMISHAQHSRVHLLKWMHLPIGNSRVLSDDICQPLLFVKNGCILCSSSRIAKISRTDVWRSFQILKLIGDACFRRLRSDGSFWDFIKKQTCRLARFDNSDVLVRKLRARMRVQIAAVARKSESSMDGIP